MKRKRALLTLGVVMVAAFTVYALKTPKSHEAVPAITAATDASLTFAPTVPNTDPARVPAPPGMVWIPGGEFSMGSSTESESLCTMPGMTRDASPVHRVYVDGFWMDATELTNEAFAAFVKDTGYVTIAERTPTAAEFPGAPPENFVGGSTVFTARTRPVTLNNHYQWCRDCR